MASSESEQVADEDAAARKAAEVAVELSEADQPQDRRRLTSALNGVARSASRVVGGTGIARRGAEVARRAAGMGVAKRGAEAARWGAGTAGRSAASLVSWLTTQVVAMGPRLRIRDQATLRAQFPGCSDEEIAELLIDRAARAAAAVGGATGAWAALPVLPAFPAEVAAETLAVVGIEIKLVAELHEAYGVPAVGSAADRARAYIGAWAHRRGVFMVPGGVLLVAGSPLARQLRRRLMARVRRSAFSLSPLFTGAVAGAMLNSRETRKLGRDIRQDLRRRPVISADPASGPPLSDPRD
jgi:hypothetical protein